MLVVPAYFPDLDFRLRNKLSHLPNNGPTSNRLGKCARLSGHDESYSFDLEGPRLVYNGMSTSPYPSSTFEFIGVRRCSGTGYYSYAPQLTPLVYL